MNEYPVRLLSRKFVLSALIVLLSSGLLVMGLIGSGEWSDVMRWVISTYLASNVFQKFSERPTQGASNAN